jgi:putative ABC transport system substrate-binding protein
MSGRISFGSASLGAYMTKRRDFVLTLPLLCAASRVEAQDARGGKSKRIGMISDQLSNIPATERPAWKTFWNALSSKGWTLGKNLEFGPEYRDTDPGRLAALAERLVLDSVDLIVSVDEEPTLAAARATQSIPILFYEVGWPMELGLVDSYARPGRNLTGIAEYAPGLGVGIKRFEYLRQVAPKAQRLSWIFGEPSWSYETLGGGRWDYAAAIDADIKRLGFEPRYHLAPTPQDIDAAFAEVAESRAHVLVATGMSALVARERIAQFALQQRLPSAGQDRRFVEAGLLLSAAVTPSEDVAILIRLAALADRLLRGESPADLPVEWPSRYELVINTKTAKALAVTIPQALLLVADELIQ